MKLKLGVALLSLCVVGCSTVDANQSKSTEVETTKQYSMEAEAVSETKEAKLNEVDYLVNTVTIAGNTFSLPIKWSELESMGFSMHENDDDQIAKVGEYNKNVRVSYEGYDNQYIEMSIDAKDEDVNVKEGYVTVVTTSVDDQSDLSDSVHFYNNVTYNSIVEDLERLDFTKSKNGIIDYLYLNGNHIQLEVLPGEYAVLQVYEDMWSEVE